MCVLKIINGSLWMKVQLDKYNYIVPIVVADALNVKFEKINDRRKKLIKLGRVDKNFPELLLNINEVDDQVENEIRGLDLFSDELKDEIDLERDSYRKVSFNNSKHIIINNHLIMGVLETNPETKLSSSISFYKDKELPKHFKNTSPRQCDHCDDNLHRSQTFVIKNLDTEELMQVGSSCMINYIKEYEIELLKFYTSANSALEEYDSMGIYNRPIFLLNKKIFLAVCNAFIRNVGKYIKREDNDCFNLMPATSFAALLKIDSFYINNYVKARSESDDESLIMVHNFKNYIDNVKISQLDLDEAENTLNWFANNPPSDDSNDFMLTLYSIMNNNETFLKKGEHGIASYSIEYIRKELERLKYQKVEEEEKELYLKRKDDALQIPVYIGEEKERFDILEVLLTGTTKKSGGMYPDSAIYFLETRDGRKIKWQASDMGKPSCLNMLNFAEIEALLKRSKKQRKEIWFTIKGTVTRQNKYYSDYYQSDLMQTEISRVVSLSDEYTNKTVTDGIMHYARKYTLSEYKIIDILTGVAVLTAEEQFCYKLEDANGVKTMFFVFEKLDLNENEFIRMPAQVNGEELVGIYPNSIEKIEKFTDNFETTELTKLKASKYNQKKIKKSKGK
jgi:hypothetical protein